MYLYGKPINYYVIIKAPTAEIGNINKSGTENKYYLTVIVQVHFVRVLKKEVRTKIQILCNLVLH